jgi:hypothetical protein
MTESFLGSPVVSARRKRALVRLHKKHFAKAVPSNVAYPSKLALALDYINKTVFPRCERCELGLLGKFIGKGFRKSRVYIQQPGKSALVGIISKIFIEDANQRQASPETFDPETRAIAPVPYWGTLLTFSHGPHRSTSSLSPLLLACA